MSDLDARTHTQIQTLCDQGDALAEREDYARALEKYFAAWDLLPDPKTEWASATWILGAIGDANFFDDDFVAGRDKLAMAMRCPDDLCYTQARPWLPRPVSDRDKFGLPTAYDEEDARFGRSLGERRWRWRSDGAGRRRG